jgi:hypothetical protein
MQSPAGSVAALSSAAATVFSIGIVFLGYWGMYEATEWHFADFAVAVLALGGFLFLGSVPFLATAPQKNPEDERMLGIARRAFLIGVAAMWLSVLVSLFT